MSKPNRKTIRLQQMRAQIAQAAGVQYVDVEFEMPLTPEQQAGGTVPEVRTCSFLTQDYWPIDVVTSVEEEGNANINVLRRVASPPEAFDALVKAAGLTVGELKRLVEELSTEAGSDPGEGSGSSPSSESTPGASAPTSSATTPAAA